MQAGEATLTPRAAETHRRILAAAESVFAERGFDAATTREIAALCELNAATPYTYFPSKEALYQAVIENAIAPLIELLDEFARELPERPVGSIDPTDFALDCPSGA